MLHSINRVFIFTLMLFKEMFAKKFANVIITDCMIVPHDIFISDQSHNHRRHYESRQ